MNVRDAKLLHTMIIMKIKVAKWGNINIPYNILIGTIISKQAIPKVTKVSVPILIGMDYQDLHAYTISFQLNLEQIELWHFVAIAKVT
jgi:hypothetical protein